MNERTDAELLELFAQGGSEEAFGALVNRHIHMVHSVALRHTADPNCAEEITQAVFIILARKAGSLAADTVLPGWLYNTARLTAANFRRMEARRLHREQEAFMRSTLDALPSDSTWKEMSPLLDDAMANLRSGDRDALVLRFFQNKTLQETGCALGIAERAAQKRVNRALEKLRRLFMKRGVVSSVAVIAGVLSAHSVQSAPIALVSTVTATSVDGAVVSATTLTLFKGTLKLMAWTKAKTAAVAGVAAILVTGSVAIARKHHAPSAAAEAATLQAVKTANTGLPEAQTQAKMLIFSAMGQQRIPAASEWCDTLNANRKLWPVTPINTLFAINSQVAGQAYSRKEISSGKLPGKTVVFFETGSKGWNKAGGRELLPQGAESIAVAFADGSAAIVAGEEIANLHWKP
jgi:RNA polymerase sigma factor (sigma-70 family)